MFVDHAGNIVLALGRSKAGKRRGEDEFGIVDSGPVASVIAAFLSQHPWDQPLIGREPHRWRKDLDALLHRVGVAYLQFRLFSSRRCHARVHARHASFGGLRPRALDAGENVANVHQGSRDAAECFGFATSIA